MTRWNNKFGNELGREEVIVYFRSPNIKNTHEKVNIDS